MVGVIVSEGVGPACPFLTRSEVPVRARRRYFLLYESMLDTVLFARDKWLVPGGALLPVCRAFPRLCFASKDR